MEQFDNWHEFWNNFLQKRYGKEEVQTEEDLFFQVARTVNRKPVSQEVFDNIIKQIYSDLDFKQDDILVDFCCGNGLFTYELRNNVKQIIGIDFAQNIIDTANKIKSAPNITYVLGSVTEYMKTFKETWPGAIPTKYLMNDSLAYFSASDLKDLLFYIKSVSKEFKFLCRGVPNKKLKWNYYDTPERKEFYHNLLAKGDLTNDGLGSWWNPLEIEAISENLGIHCFVRNQELPVSNYRMDIIFSNK